jgi:hypothetical protein
MAQVSRRVTPYLAGPWFMLALAAMMLVTYAIDLATPLGVPVWLLYFIPLLLSFWSKALYAVPTVCVVTLLFLAAGFVFSPPGIQTSSALFIRIVYSAVFIVVSALLWMIRRKQERAGILKAL